MNKRYQVFVSSTYADLKEERQKVIQMLMEMDCIPSGMELFPAMDEEQLEFIKRIIDDCDYYLIIIGGRYGSLTKDGISYTEKEYDYAIEKGIKVLAFIHESPDSLTVEKSDIAPELREKLKIFREKVQTGRVVKFWKVASELPSMVSLSLTKTMKTYPAIGWIRASIGSSEELLAELNNVRKKSEKLRKEKESIEKKLAKLKPGSECNDDIEELNDKFKLTCEIEYFNFAEKYEKRYTLKKKIILAWKEIFYMIAPTLVNAERDDHISRLFQPIYSKLRPKYEGCNSIDITKESLIQIRQKLYDLDLIQISYLEHRDYIGKHLSWKLTRRGEKLLINSQMKPLKIIKQKTSITKS